MLCNPLGLQVEFFELTRNPDGLKELQKFFEAQIGPYWLGVVGDASHTGGYHLGANSVPLGDYSIVSERDRNGIKMFGGDFASACDIGMGWAASRLWFRWLIEQLRNGRFPDVVEVIGSADGIQDYRYTAEDGFLYAELWFGNHVEHTHISFYRDSIMRSHIYLFDTWTATGRVVAKPSVAPKRTPVVQTAAPAPSPRPQTRGSSSTPLRGTFAVLAIGGVAWMIKRRMELLRENSR